MIERFAIALTLLLAASSVRAEECPKESPDDPAQRRALAKKWFAKGETEARANNDVAALKAYQCSLTFVPHGFTAYNVAQIAEKIGDLEVAIASYEQYLLLVPDAKDSAEVSERIEVLKGRLAKARESDTGAASQPPLDTLMGKGHDEPPAEPPVATLPPPALAPGPVAPGADDSLSASRRSAARYRTAAWISLGGGGVLVLGGVLTNVLARNSMDTCRKEYSNGNQSGADSACTNAKPLAYMSYSLLGLGAAAAATGAVLMIVRPGESSDVAMGPLPEGGLSVRWSGRF